MSRFLEALDQGVLVADGGMGSLIHQLADHDFRTPDEVVLTQPDLVLGIHVRYLRAGARVIETNTFGANRPRLDALGLADKVVAINGKAVKLAREAREIAGVDAFIAGSIGPTGLRVDGDPAVRQLVHDAFREQALALDDRGVDLFILETFQRPEELAVAVEAVRGASGLPIVAQVALPTHDDWSDGDTPDDDALAILDQLVALGADVVGLNCSMGPAQLLPSLQALGRRAGGTPLACQPNSGLPRREGGRFVFPETGPSYFGAFAVDAANVGARLVGGCCGTGPEHVEAMAKALEGWQPGDHRPAPEPTRAKAAHVDDDEVRGSGIAERFAAGEFVVSMQVDPPKGTRPDMIVQAVQKFRDSGHVHCVDVNSNPMARLHMDALWMSARLEREGIETIAHYTPRDASLMGIEGNLLGAWDAGVRNVLVITGDPSVVRGEPGAGDVYQTDSIGMVRYLSQLNEGRDCFGNAIGHPPRFHIGVAVNPNHADLDTEVDRFKAKVDAGAHFAMTQVFFEWGCWERFLDKLGGTCPIPVMIAVWPLTSFRLASRLHHEVPGIVLPDHVLKALEAAGPDARKVGFDLARDMLAGSRERAQGVYVIAPFKRPVAALELFETP